MPGDRLTFSQLLSKWRGENVAYELDPYRAPARRALEAARGCRDLEDRELAARLGALRPGPDGAGEGPGPLEELAVEAFALVHEAARRSLGLEAFETQLMAASAMARGKVAELATGEGKTLAAVFAASLLALGRKGVHVLTTNDYLARRDAAWMGPVYERLGLTVGLLQGGAAREERQRAYAADVTYGTLAEVGFDLLRDGLLRDARAIVQRRGLAAAILDDIDSTLIDEARHPLVIAGEEPGETGDGGRVDRAVRALVAREHFDLDEHREAAFLTDEGAARLEEVLEVEDLYAEEGLELLTRVNLALHAHAVLGRDVDYLVRDGRIELIDEHRGRVAEGRRLPDGIQGALEEKEGLARSAASRIYAQTSLQAVARLYPLLAGMTATAASDAEELGALYGLEVVVIPPNRPCARQDYIDLIFTHGEARDRAVLEEIDEALAAGRPVLVGTASVEESETLGAALGARGIACRVLNARNDELEAEIVAEAGAPRAVTISTRMAGRGTDIRLGGSDEARRDEVVAAGGLAVVGTRRSESARADDQLRGRAGRQGDPGSSQLLVSLDDELFVRYGVGELLPARYRELRSDEPLLDRKVVAEVDRAQRIIAARASAVRKTLWGYDGVVEGQRRAVWRRRRLVLLGRADPALEEACPERWAELLGRLGEARLRAVERAITLGWIDRAWADHLARLADVRDQVQLMTSGVSVGTGFGRERPMGTYRRLAKESYEAFEREVDEGVAATFESDAVSERGLDLEAAGLAPPRRTWTSIVKEQPLDTRPPPRLPVTLARKLADLLRGKR